MNAAKYAADVKTNEPIICFIDICFIWLLQNRFKTLTVAEIIRLAYSYPLPSRHHLKTGSDSFPGLVDMVSYPHIIRQSDEFTKSKVILFQKPANHIFLLKKYLQAKFRRILSRIHTPRKGHKTRIIQSRI